MDDAPDENSPAALPDDPTPPPKVGSSAHLAAAVPVSPSTYWLRKFFVCNPFYLASAALLLYGVYLVSSDTGLFQRESVQLAFNFGSLQFYEALLVVTAIILARRAIWYDSLLLVGLENLLVLVPFILISQAALLNQPTVWIVCLVGGVAVLGRFYGLKRFLAELNLPRRTLICGAALLIVNVALPLVFRHFHDTKIGTKPTEGAAYEINRCSWLLLLPAMFALINLLPRPRSTGELLPQRRWLPLGLFALWLVASGVHIYSLSYVYNFDWEPVFKAPLLWVATWTLYLRRHDFLDQHIAVLDRILIVPPALVTLCAMDHGDKPVFLALTILNLAGYAVLFMKQHGNRTALVLLLASVEAIIAALWKQSPQSDAMYFRRDEWIVIATAAFLLFGVMRSRNPKVGLLGSLIILVTGFFLSRFPGVEYVTPHLALAFLVLHSLQWNETGGDAIIFRWFACAAWLVHTSFMVYSDWDFALPLVYAMGGSALVICVVLRILSGSWKPAAVPVSALLVLLAHPGDLLAHKMLALPVGLIAVAGSFVLFALGTLAALTKSRWNHPTVTVFPSINKPEALVL